MTRRGDSISYKNSTAFCYMNTYTHLQSSIIFLPHCEWEDYGHQGLFLPLRDERYYNSIIDFCVAFNDRTINHIGDVKLHVEEANGLDLIILILEPSPLIEEDMGMIYT